jgi:hypothetical protein
MIAMQPLSAAEFCARYNAMKEARALLREGMMPAEFLAALMAHRQYSNAIEFLARALSIRAAVWWGCLCLHHACGALLAPPDRDALLAATVWVIWPTEDYRAAAQAPAQAAGAVSAGGALAMAVSVAGVSGPVPLTPAKAVANAVKLATLRGDPARIADTQRLYVELGIGVAEGRFTWPRA